MITQSQLLESFTPGQIVAVKVIAAQLIEELAERGAFGPYDVGGRATAIRRREVVNFALEKDFPIDPLYPFRDHMKAATETASAPTATANASFESRLADSAAAA